MHKKITILIILINFAFSSIHGMESKISQEYIKNSYIIVAEKENKFKQYKIDLKDARNHPFLDLYIAFFGDERIEKEGLIIRSKTIFDSLKWQDLQSVLDDYPYLKSLWLTFKLINYNNELTANDIYLPTDIEHYLTYLLLHSNRNELFNLLCVNIGLLNAHKDKDNNYEKIGNGEFCYYNPYKWGGEIFFYKTDPESMITTPIGDIIVSIYSCFKIAENANIILCNNWDQENKSRSFSLFDLKTEKQTTIGEKLSDDCSSFIGISPDGKYATISTIFHSKPNSYFFSLYDISDRENIQLIKEINSETLQGISFFSPDSTKLILVYDDRYDLWNLKNIHTIIEPIVIKKDENFCAADVIIFNADNEHLFLIEDKERHQKWKQQRLLNIKDLEISKIYELPYYSDVNTIHPHAFTNHSDFIISYQSECEQKLTIYTKRGIIVDLPCKIPGYPLNSIQDMDNNYVLTQSRGSSITLWQHAIDGNCYDAASFNYSLKKLMTYQYPSLFKRARLENNKIILPEWSSCTNDIIPLLIPENCLPKQITFNQLGCLLHLSQGREPKKKIILDEKHPMKKHFDSFESDDKRKLKKLLLLEN